MFESTWLHSNRETPPKQNTAMTAMTAASSSAHNTATLSTTKTYCAFRPPRQARSTRPWAQKYCFSCVFSLCKFLIKFVFFDSVQYHTGKVSKSLPGAPWIALGRLSCYSMLIFAPKTIPKWIIICNFCEVWRTLFFSTVPSINNDSASSGGQVLSSDSHMFLTNFWTLPKVEFFSSWAVPGRQKAPVLNFRDRFRTATGFEGGPGRSPKLTREPKIMLKSKTKHRYTLRPRLGTLFVTILHHF
jgi:hypothetical protein